MLSFFVVYFLSRCLTFSCAPNLVSSVCALDLLGFFLQKHSTCSCPQSNFVVCCCFAPSSFTSSSSHKYLSVCSKAIRLLSFLLIPTVLGSTTNQLRILFVVAAVACSFPIVVPQYFLVFLQFHTVSSTTLQYPSVFLQNKWSVFFLVRCCCCSCIANVFFPQNNPRLFSSLVSFNQSTSNFLLFPTCCVTSLQQWVSLFLTSFSSKLPH